MTTPENLKGASSVNPPHRPSPRVSAVSIEPHLEVLVRRQVTRSDSKIYEVTSQRSRSNQRGDPFTERDRRSIPAAIDWIYDAGGWERGPAGEG